jgi:LysM repeat protein
MAEHRRRRSATRLVAPLALLLSIAAVLVVIQTSTKSDSSGDRANETAGQTTQQRQRQQRRRGPTRANYTVKLNDTLGLISEKTGVPVERLQTLNPELDPQNLVVGQRIKLRE